VTFDRDFWEQRWEQALREHPEAVATRPPNAHLLAAAEDLAPGNALDAGCGHGAETLWLASQGWRVTAVDFSATALAAAQSRAEAIGADVATRVDWIEADLGTWEPDASRFDLVNSLHVHIAGSVGEFVTRLANGVAPGGTLFLVGHLPGSGQQQVNVADAVAVLDPSEWTIVVAEERERVAQDGVDAIVRAIRR
jgi:2-polyprenyl-3-methyl-5-hydroxy-6-metoxy-1,4-benzoquinol methylase